MPRYRAPRDFAGMHIVDKLWGSHFHTDKHFAATDEQKESVRRALQVALDAVPLE